MLWRISDEPIIALDGDTAGLRAAYRVIDLALPLLEAGKSLRFVLMPEGQDPDDLIRSKGPDGVQRVLDNAMPMVRLLWKRETEGRSFDSPERKAALDKALREKIKLIRDPSLRAHYGQDIKDLRWSLFRSGRTAGIGGFGKKPKLELRTSNAKSSLLVAQGDEAQDRMREAVIVAAMVVCPDILPEYLDDLAEMTCGDDDVAMVRDALVRLVNVPKEQLRGRLDDILGPGALETLLSARHVAITPCVRHPEDVALAKLTVRDELAKLSAHRGLALEIAEAERDLNDLGDEAVTWRLGEAAAARAQAERSAQEDDRQYDQGANGANIDKDERDAFDALLKQIGYGKTRT
jgi:DNA primase